MTLSWEPDQLDYELPVKKSSRLGKIISTTVTVLSDTLGISRAWPCIVAVWRRFVQNTGIALGVGGTPSRGPIWECEELKRGE